MYYRCGAMDKGDEFMRKMIKNCVDKAEYYGGMEPKFVDYYTEDIDEQVSILHQMQTVANQYGRLELKSELDPIMQDYLQRYYLE
jgi:hypothetical protein